MTDWWVILAWATPAGVLGIVGAALVVKHRSARRVRPATAVAPRRPVDDEIQLADQPIILDRAPVDPTVLATTLDWYVLRHLEDQRRMPLQQRFLDEDRRRNAILNRSAVQRLADEGIEVRAPASTATESIRPDGVSNYIPRYFPDEEFDSALAMYKHEMIAHRLLETISRLHLLRDSAAARLSRMSALRLGYTPYVPDAYVSFYNDLVGAADNFDRESGLREKMRLLALRVVFPIEEKQIDYWRQRGFEVYQVPAKSARELLAEWFRVAPADLPLAP